MASFRAGTAMQPTLSKASSEVSSLLQLAFVLAGLFVSPLFFAGAFLLLGAQLAKKNKRLGMAVAGAGVLYFLLVAGYGIGKDMALRDNAQAVGAVSNAR
jgi:multisubunit Na+/H+ antiporter MnhC subunit